MKIIDGIYLTPDISLSNFLGRFPNKRKIKHQRINFRLLIPPIEIR